MFDRNADEINQSELEAAKGALNSKLEAKKLDSKKGENDDVSKLEESTKIESEVDSTLLQNTEETRSDDPFLKQALEMGYNPNYKGDNKKSPEQFVRDGSFFRKIDSLKKEQEEMKELVKRLADHNDKIEKASYERVKRELANAKLDAVKNGDVEKFTEIERQEESVKLASQPIQRQVEPKLSAEVVAFKEKHASWLTNNSQDPTEIAMRGLVREKAAYYMNHPEIDDVTGLKDIENALKTAFPHKFENLEQRKPATVLSGSSTSATIEGQLSSRLNDNQKRLLKLAQKYNTKLTPEKYAKQLLQTGDLRDE